MTEQTSTAALAALAALLNRVPRAQRQPASTLAGAEFNRGFLEGIQAVRDATRGGDGAASFIAERLQATAGVVAARLLQQEKEELRGLYEEARRQITPEMLAEIVEQAENQTGLAESIPSEVMLRELEELARQQRSARK